MPDKRQRGPGPRATTVTLDTYRRQMVRSDRWEEFTPEYREWAARNNSENETRP